MTKNKRYSLSHIIAWIVTVSVIVVGFYAAAWLTCGKGAIAYWTLLWVVVWTIGVCMVGGSFISDTKQHTSMSDFVRQGMKAYQNSNKKWGWLLIISGAFWAGATYFAKEECAFFPLFVGCSFIPSVRRDYEPWYASYLFLPIFLILLGSWCQFNSWIWTGVFLIPTNIICYMVYSHYNKHAK